MFAMVIEMPQKTVVFPTWIKVSLPAVLIVGLYNDWILSPFLNHRLSSVVSLISEISARTQPYHELYRVIDTTAGVVTLLSLPLLARFLRQRRVGRRWLLLGVVALIGLGSMIDASLPISCAPSVDRACNLATTNSLVTDAHLVESTLVGAITFFAPLVWWWQMRRRQNLAGLAGRLSLYFVALQVAVGLTILGAQGLHIAIIGLLQRAYEAGIGAWLAAMTGLAVAHMPVRLVVDEPELQPLSDFSLSENSEA